METRGKKTWWKPVKFDNFVTIYCNIKDWRRFELNEKNSFSLICQSRLMRLSQNPGDLNFGDNALLWIPLNNTLSFFISYFSQNKYLNINKSIIFSVFKNQTCGLNDSRLKVQMICEPCKEIGFIFYMSGFRISFWKSD